MSKLWINVGDLDGLTNAIKVWDVATMWVYIICSPKAAFWEGLILHSTCWRPQPRPTTNTRSLYGTNTCMLVSMLSSPCPHIRPCGGCWRVQLGQRSNRATPRSARCARPAMRRSVHPPPRLKAMRALSMGQRRVERGLIGVREVQHASADLGQPARWPLKQPLGGPVGGAA